MKFRMWFEMSLDRHNAMLQQIAKHGPPLQFDPRSNEPGYDDYANIPIPAEKIQKQLAQAQSHDPEGLTPPLRSFMRRAYTPDEAKLQRQQWLDKVSGKPSQIGAELINLINQSVAPTLAQALIKVLQNDPPAFTDAIQNVTTPEDVRDLVKWYRRQGKLAA